MGLLAELLKVNASRIAVRNAAPGQQIVVTGTGLGGVSAEAEVYHPHGIFSRPPKGSKVVVIPLAGGKTRVAISGVNYQIEIAWTLAGETVIYSTNAAGDTVKAQIYLDKDGNILLNGSSKRLVTADELQSALSTLCATLAAHVHPSTGVVSPGLVGLACDISAAKTTTIKTGG